MEREISIAPTQQLENEKNFLTRGKYTTMILRASQARSTIRGNPSYVPTFTTGLTDRMTFWERMFNVCSQVS